jgi:hypothetical protein
MTTLPEEAVKAALDTWLDHEFDGTLNYPRMRNALTAAIPFLTVQGAVKADAIKLIERMAFGYEVMFEKLCHISGTSGVDQSWYRAKAREATERLSPLHSITTESNKSIPGDCKRQYQDFMSRILSALEPSAARELALEEACKLVERRINMVPSDTKAFRAYQDACRHILGDLRALHPQADKPSDDGAQGEVAQAGTISHCWKCGSDEASTYLGKPGPGAVKCFAVGCDAEISGFSSDKEAIAEWNRRSLAMDAAMTEAYYTDDEDELTECFRHHILTTIGWQAFGARTGKEMQMYEEGFKAGYRRCKSDNEPEFGEEELSHRARKMVGRLRESIKAGAVNLSDVEDAVDFIIDQDARSLSSQPVADGLPQDVINLVIASREFWEDHYSDLPSSHALDEALEAFSSRVLTPPAGEVA